MLRGGLLIQWIDCVFTTALNLRVPRHLIVIEMADVPRTLCFSSSSARVKPQSYTKNEQEETTHDERISESR